jgi:hypothetical protein
METVMQDIVIARPDPSSLVAEAAPLVERASKIVVTDVAEHATAQESIKTLRGLEKRITDAFEPTRKSLDTSKKELLALRDGMLRPLETARLTIDRTCGAYETEQRRIAEAETKRLQEEASKQEEERAFQEALAAEDAGDSALAQSILEEPAPAPVVYVAPKIAKVEGMSSQTRWHAEVVDKHALDRYVAEHPEFSCYTEPSMPNLNRAAVSQRGALRIPGVRSVPTSHRTTRTA